MSSAQVPSLIGASFSDVLAALSFGASNVGGSMLGMALDALLRRRLEAARDILLDEIRAATRPIKDAANGKGCERSV